MNCAKRFFSALMCLVLIAVSFASCADTESTSETTTQPTTAPPVINYDKAGFTLAYLHTDSLNPYDITTETNRDIAGLMFDPLFNVGNDFKPVPVIAESYSYTDDNVITVKIRQNLKFSDGSALTADDIVYSFVLAKKSDFYSPSLKNISDASNSGNGNVVFTLRSENPYEASNLCFPIIKKNSDNNNSGSSNTSSIPIGSGRYIFKEENNTKKLIANKTRLGSYIPVYNYISLRDVTEEASVTSLFDLNEVDFYTQDFAEGNYKRYSGTSTYYETTNFVFLGINSDSEVLKESKVRRAISLLLDREMAATSSFSGFAVPTSTPFHPSFYGIKGCSYMPVKSDRDSATELLNAAGFKNISSTYGFRYNDEGDKLELRLLVNKENSFKLSIARNIQQTLAEADIVVTIKEYSYNNYVQAVRSGSYDLYIGEVKLPASFNLNAFFKENGGASFGINPECKSAEDYRLLLKGDKTIQEFLDTFADDLPFIPLVYRKGVAIKKTRIKTAPKTIVSDYLYNISEWTAE